MAKKPVHEKTDIHKSAAHKRASAAWKKSASTPKRHT